MTQKTVVFDRVVEEICEYLKTCGDVAVAYLFGSRATGKARSDSDYDIAVLFTKLPSPGELLALRADLVFITEKLDLVVLNSASAPLRHEVLKHGKTLLLVDREGDVELRYRTFREYQDFLDCTGWRTNDE